MGQKINFEIITLLEYTYPLLVMGIWYQQFRPLRPDNVRRDYEAKKIDPIIFTSLFELISFENRLRDYKHSEPGLSIIFLN